MRLNRFTNLASDVVGRWATQPDEFVRDMFQVEPDEWQISALRALHEVGRVTIRACHGPGKSAVDSWAIFWFMMCYFPTRIPCTAPTSHQLEDILWAEAHKWHRQMDPRFRDLFLLTSERISWAPAPKESFAVARTARPEKPEALQGFHCENLLFILDEASGIDDAIFEVSEGALSDENAKVLMTANPTRRSGYFYDSHNKMRHRWWTQKVDHTMSDRVSDTYVEDMGLKWGVDSNVYRVRVLGEFPTEDEDVVIPLELAESALVRQVEPWGEWVWGLDVAGKSKNSSADRSPLCKRRANSVEEIKYWRELEPMQLVGKVVEEWDDTPDHELPTAIYVDSIGLGAGVVSRLRELDLPVIGINVAETATEKEKYVRLRDDLWFKTRYWLAEKDVRIREGNLSEELVAELTTPTYTTKSNGKQEVESKDDLKDRGVQSPDLADSLIITMLHRFEKSSRRGAIAYSRAERHKKSNEEHFRGIV